MKGYAKVVSEVERTAYFDNAATTFPKPEAVYTFMDSFYREYGVNVGRGQHKLASKASSLVADTRAMLLDLFHAPNKKTVLTHTATEALNIILRGLPISDGYTIYLSPFEHNAVTRVISHLGSIYNIDVQTLTFDKRSYTYDLDKIKLQFAEKRPNIVVMSHASNAFGIIAPVTEICLLSKSYGAINVVDMCQTAGLIDIDMSNAAIDFAVFAGHKTLYGPLGVAGFICNDAVVLHPLIYGGTGVDSLNQRMPDTIPERFEAASPNIHAISGLYAALKWIQSIGIKAIYEKEKDHHRKLSDVLSEFDNIHMCPPIGTDGCIGVVSCVFDGYGSDSIGRILSDNDIAVRTGLHCAPYAHDFLGTSPGGTVRFSISYFNIDDDFEKLADVLNHIHENS